MPYSKQDLVKQTPDHEDLSLAKATHSQISHDHPDTNHPCQKKNNENSNFDHVLNSIFLLTRSTQSEIVSDDHVETPRVQSETRHDRWKRKSDADESARTANLRELLANLQNQTRSWISSTNWMLQAYMAWDVGVDLASFTQLVTNSRLVFHHDGPFDACNPHRNRRKEKYAPMQAFPKDSINMVMGGSGPVNKRMDYDKFHGYGQEAHIDFNEAAIAEGVPEQAAPTYAYNPTAREAIHGDESVGLGTSTFLEGAPASRAAIQRRESEYETQQVDERPGLSRKKSLAQKIRGVRPRDRLASPGDGGPISPPLTGQSDSAVNPFFRNYEQKDKDGTTIQFAENQPRPTRPRAPSSPKRNELERRNTADSPPEDGNKPSGLLGRMKSLKSSKRPVRRDTSG